MPFELLVHTLSHLKALIKYCFEPSVQGSGRTFIMCHTFLKNAILLNTKARVPRFSVGSVHYLLVQKKFTFDLMV